ncbi:RNA polymerase sigma-70 factor [Rhodococcus chondri]|uniref:RNA polymerase sigma-70 factor n=1 Tax=Rhodococcus chondri TaxID=3065941 RepID=A0ABU7JKK9_9NOCA|nr:RNA polymerase sigma-70 factor [Rhodococcus sp. CC-R104]MEE2030570.1 RNA polymerase sigma-70 factor [Rhodococcus sp. CC-R104]
MTGVEEFENLRPLLFAIAYRILGSATEAEDAVQETWVRYETSGARPDSPKAFLSTVVTRVSINVLESARARREQYVGEWLPEPILDEPYDDPARSAELTESVSMAALVLLERLSPLERAVFVLREAFGFGFAEIAEIVDRSEAACRQLAVRARRHVDRGSARFDTDPHTHEQLTARFLTAFQDGNVDGLRELLAADVQLVADGGGKTPAIRKIVLGNEKVMRLLASYVSPMVRLGMVLEPHDVNRHPGLIARDDSGALVQIMTFDVVDGKIGTIRVVVNPDKLAHLGRVADVRALAQQLRDLQRP